MGVSLTTKFNTTIQIDPLYGQRQQLQAWYYITPLYILIFTVLFYIDKLNTVNNWASCKLLPGSQRTKLHLFHLLWLAYPNLDLSSPFK